jgi:hypothetical protein
MRHWLHGGATDVANMVLLCDTDHGLAHDLELVMTRRAGRLVVTAPDGRRVWGAADAAFHAGVAGLGEVDDGRVAGVQPLDTAVGRRPTAAQVAGERQRPVGTAVPSGTQEARPGAAQAPGGAAVPGGAEAAGASITRLLFPDRRPDLPDEVHVNGEPMDLAYVVGVLLANRDLERRLAAEKAGRRAAVA